MWNQGPPGASRPSASLAVERVELLARRELGADLLILVGGERPVGRVPAHAEVERGVRKPIAVEVHLLQVAHEDLLGLRVLELVDDADEVGEPLAIHAAAGDLPLAEVEEAL